MHLLPRWRITPIPPQSVGKMDLNWPSGLHRTKFSWLENGIRTSSHKITREKLTQRLEQP